MRKDNSAVHARNDWENYKSFQRMYGKMDYKDFQKYLEQVRLHDCLYRAELFIMDSGKNPSWFRM